MELKLFSAFLSFSIMIAVSAAQVWDVDRLIRARNPNAEFRTTERATTTWQTIRSITYNPEFEAGSVGSPSVEEASLVRRVRPTKGLDETNGAASFSNSAVLLLISSFGLCFLTF